MFEAEGLYFELSFALHDARIIKLNALINEQRCFQFLIEEALNYKWKLDKKNPTGKPRRSWCYALIYCRDLPPNLKELNLSALPSTGNSSRTR